MRKKDLFMAEIIGAMEKENEPVVENAEFTVVETKNDKELIPAKKRGHRPKVGGKNSQGTILKALRFSTEMVKAIERKIGKGKSFSEYIRGLVKKDLTK